MNQFELDTLSDAVLEKIRRRKGHPYNPARLAASLSVTPDELTEAIDRLRKLGYIIKTDKNKYPAFISAPDMFLPAEIVHGLKTKFIGKRVHAFRSVQSTNTIAHKLAVNKAPEGTLVIAERQTKGRGRMGRSWHSPENVGLYCSVILYPKIQPILAPGISLISAVALAETISAYDTLDVKIKWPNDVLISGRKTAGILTELSAEIGRTNFVVVGVGVNINHRRQHIPDELKKMATSIRIALKENIRRVEFLQRFLLNLEKEYIVFRKSGLRAIRGKILRFSLLLNREIILKMGRRVISGKVADINEVGQLVLETKEGLQLFNAGEVTTH